MKTYTLKTAKRTLLGHKVTQLRKQGMIPATIYGKKIKSESIQCNATEFLEVYKNAGETGVVELFVENGKKSDKRPVLIHFVQRHPVSGQVLHVEFRQVDLKEKVEASVPLIQVKECPAVEKKTGVLLTLIDSVDVEALPTDLPDNIEVDVSGLEEEGQEILVKDLKIPSNVDVVTDKETQVVRIAPLIQEEETPPEPEEEETAEPTEGEAEETKETDEQKKDTDAPEKKPDDEKGSSEKDKKDTPQKK